MFVASLLLKIAFAQGLKNENKVRYILRSANMSPQDRLYAHPEVGLNLHKKISYLSELPEPSKTHYSLLGELKWVRWDEEFYTRFLTQDVEYMAIVGIRNTFTEACQVSILGHHFFPWDPRCQARHSDGSIKVPLDEIDPYDSIHLLLFHRENSQGWFISKNVLDMALPFWHRNAMLHPMSWFILVLIFTALLLMLMSSCGRNHLVVELKSVRVDRRKSLPWTWPDVDYVPEHDLFKHIRRSSLPSRKLTPTVRGCHWSLELECGPRGKDFRRHSTGCFCSPPGSPRQF